MIGRWIDTLDDWLEGEGPARVGGALIALGMLYFALQVVRWIA